ncbi:hypothetical protein [Marinobacter sp. HN1S83]|uniref:hypothetical protein n=1 Tax=Marinobacter sp. HN1S83 TaxID=3382301 RepID=UPI00387AD81F
MNNELPEYQGKPTVYLDQNVLDILVGGGCDDFQENLKNKFQIVYSDETLKEIKRSGEGARDFLKLLNDLNASHLKIVLSQPEFKETGKAAIFCRDIFEAFDEYCKNSDEYADIQRSMEQWMYKYSGGRKGEGITEIHNDQKIAFANLMKNLRCQISEIAEAVPGIESLFEGYEEQMLAQLSNSLEQTEEALTEHVGDGKFWSGVEDFRAATGVGPKQLNNLKPPKIIHKIWEILESTPPFKGKEVSVEQFFDVSANPIYPDRPIYPYQKVNAVYNLLNTVGYWPDSKVQKERRFIASLSDNSHASMASFCHLLLSRDTDFVKKVEAAYEYLEIGTVVKQVVVNNA